MNVAAHHKKKKNEKMKTGKTKAGKERKQATYFKEAACCPTAVVQGAARWKNSLCEERARGNWESRKGQQPFRSNPNRFGDRTSTLRRLLIGPVLNSSKREISNNKIDP